MSPAFRNIVITTLALTFIVVVLGAYVRLSDAGLGCPDWPGCYGKMLGVPTSQAELGAANSNYQRPVEIDKAWKEMIHRYFAGALGILIFIISILLFKKDSQGRRHIAAAVLLSGVLLFQALLGMWTVTLQLKPLIVMGHLLGGFALFNLIAWQWLRCQSFSLNGRVDAKLLKLALIALLVLVCQIALGGWVSSNYAALACVDFPKCQQSWWPPMDFTNGFIIWRGLGIDYEFGVLDHPARVAIHYTHRLAALVTALVIFWYAFGLIKQAQQAGPALKNIAVLMLGLLVLQVSLGISNILFKLPLFIAVMHNGVALLLLFSLVSSLYMINCAQNLRT